MAIGTGVSPTRKPSAVWPMVKEALQSTVNPGAITTNLTITSTITVPNSGTTPMGEGAAVGDGVIAWPGTDMTNLTWSASISAANTIKLSIANLSAGTITPASSTWTFLVFYQGDWVGVGI